MWSARYFQKYLPSLVRLGAISLEHKLHRNLVLNDLIRVKLPPQKDYEAEMSIVSTSSERIEECRLSRCGLPRERGSYAICAKMVMLTHE